MKTLIVVAICGLAAVSAVPRPEEGTDASGPNANADPSADPHYGYWGGYGGWGWGGYYRPWGYGYWGRKKRSTEDEEKAAGPNANADPSADPWYGYYGHGWGGYYGHGWGGYYRPWGYGYWGRKKRSTEDEENAAGPNANADPSADPWYGYYGHRYGYGGLGWGGYYRPWGYGYWGRKKRSADEEPESGPNADPTANANADPWYGYYGHRWGYSGLGWGGYFRPYGYGYWGRKKRSADEEPESGPNADPSADPHYAYWGTRWGGWGGWGGYYRPWGYGYWGRK